MEHHIENLEAPEAVIEVEDLVGADETGGLSTTNCGGTFGTASCPATIGTAFSFT